MGQQTNKTQPIKPICAGLLAHVDADRVVLPASTWARMPITSLSMYRIPLRWSVQSDLV